MSETITETPEAAPEVNPASADWLQSTPAPSPEPSIDDLIAQYQREVPESVATDPVADNTGTPADDSVERFLEQLGSKDTERITALEGQNAQLLEQINNERLSRTPTAGARTAAGGSGRGGTFGGCTTGCCCPFRT
jgi:hypothetical protein